MSETKTEYHWLDLMLTDGLSIEATVVCRAPEGAPCRMWSCTEACTDSAEPGGCEHAKVDGGSCGVVPWFQEQDWADMVEDYDGGTAQLRSGPITIEADYESASWHYADQFIGVIRHPAQRPSVATKVSEGEATSYMRVDVFAGPDPDHRQHAGTFALTFEEAHEFERRIGERAVR